ncbi:transcriptional regulator, SarA/Rot family [Cytobacillus sp. IB215316]|uniref:transcriptional regulator, SarA/Rot family n=1 Tax=Cytobacillus sp. IB215316 TaxID=3097354 RepID=UPI002A0BD7CE|nr:hypothetical protein [Cytobacillus sp. IB215316]MDX8363012.1 hypothetical protein [Cytobacillus sp. IB215316]
MVTRKRSKEDERSVLISLTDKGVRLKEETSAIPTMIFDKTGLSNIRDLLKH